MSEQGDLNQTIVEEGGTEQERATPENGIVKSESLDEEEKLELQVSLEKTKQNKKKKFLVPTGLFSSFYFETTLKICFYFFKRV